MQDFVLIASERNATPSPSAGRCARTALFPSTSTSRYDQDTIDRSDQSGAGRPFRPNEGLQIEVAGEAGVFLDVVEAQLGAAAHQGFDQLFGSREALAWGFDR